jgi:hypothetical protein
MQGFLCAGKLESSFFGLALRFLSFDFSVDLLDSSLLVFDWFVV